MRLLDPRARGPLEQRLEREHGVIDARVRIADPANRAGTVAIVNSRGSRSSSSSSQVIGVDTVPYGFPRTEYALAIVWSRAFWL